MNREILENDKSDIYNSEENNNIELEQKNKLIEKKEYDVDYSFYINNNNI